MIGVVYLDNCPVKTLLTVQEQQASRMHPCTFGSSSWLALNLAIIRSIVLYYISYFISHIPKEKEKKLPLRSEKPLPQFTVWNISKACNPLLCVR
jgi:hypothetical protein